MIIDVYWLDLGGWHTSYQYLEDSHWDTATGLQCADAGLAILMKQNTAQYLHSHLMRSLHKCLGEKHFEEIVVVTSAVLEGHQQGLEHSLVSQIGVEQKIHEMVAISLLRLLSQ